MADDKDAIQLIQESVNPLPVDVLHEAHGTAVNMLNSSLLAGIRWHVDELRRLARWHAATHAEGLRRVARFECEWGLHARNLTDELIPWEWRLCPNEEAFNAFEVDSECVIHCRGRCVLMLGHKNTCWHHQVPLVDRQLAARQLVIGDITVE